MTKLRQDLKDDITDYFNDRGKVCLETVQEALLTVIVEVMAAAPDCVPRNEVSEK